MAVAPALREVFAANRSVGRISLEVGADGSASRVRRLYEDGPLRLRCPNGPALEAVIVNTAGGIAGGDRHTFDIDAHPGASIAVTTAAAEKVYRALGPDAEIAVNLSAAAGARLVWLPQETILFDGARLNRRIDADVAEGGSLLIAEATVFGRTAMGEVVEQGAFVDRWQVRRCGRLAFAETFRLNGAVARLLAETPVTGGAVAMATVLVMPGNDEMAGRVRTCADFVGEVAVSAWNGLAVARLCAKDGAALRRDLAAVLRALGVALPRLWTQ